MIISEEIFWIIFTGFFSAICSAFITYLFTCYTRKEIKIGNILKFLLLSLVVVFATFFIATLIFICISLILQLGFGVAIE